VSVGAHANQAELSAIERVAAEHPHRDACGALGFDVILVWGATIVSVVQVLGFGTLVVLARLHDGEWPRPRSGPPFDGSHIDGSIDPNTFEPLWTFVWVTMLPAFVLVPLATFTILAGVLVPKLRQPAWIVGAFVLSNAIIAATVLLDPFGFFLWFLD
jgi:hypothetical protein